jgi:hypothetical protein
VRNCSRISRSSSARIAVAMQRFYSSRLRPASVPGPARPLRTYRALR